MGYGAEVGGRSMSFNRAPDPVDDPERRWITMRELERAGQLRLPLPGVPDPAEEEYEAARKAKKGKA